MPHVFETANTSLSSRIAQNNRLNNKKAHWRAFRGLRQHKMKIILVSCVLLCASVTFVKGKYFTEYDLSENLEDELNELEPWELEDHHEGPHKPPGSLKNAFEVLLKCFTDEEHGRMKKKCIRKFKQALPQDIPDSKKMMKCIIRSFKKCQKQPKEHEPMNCMIAFKNCIEGEGEGSGNWI